MWKSSTKELQVLSQGLTPIDQLKVIITGTIENKLDGSSNSGMIYTKQYTRRIDNLKIQSATSNVQQFDSKENPKRHVVHFIETPNSPVTYGDPLVKKFVRSMKKNAFDQYTDLEVNSVDI
ncbi:UNVERIFIED_CONTAM: hypothetical protein Sangu_2630400 [Sesamum angustifolium]|uniref:Uncharacterized protein n=1 Tax=Sesamum angustifolium TaxID=2727405 RepID=A0AAW2J675_9LAMI